MSIEQLIQENTEALKTLTDAVSQLASASPKATKKVAAKVEKVELTGAEGREVTKVVEKVTEVVEVVEETVAVEGLTLDDVRKKLTPLVADHNATIAETIKELGAAKLSELDASKYGELIDAINAKIGA